MINIKNTRVYGLNESLIRSGYPMTVGDPKDRDYDSHNITDHNDLKRGVKLGKVPNGTGHDNFLKGIIVQFDLRYPEYFSPQLQRYSWIDIVSSQSKMHKITSRELTVDDFTEHTWTGAIDHVNALVKLYNATESVEQKKQTFKEIISVLPSGYMKWMGISTNYLQLKTIHKQRRHHKLDEWQHFCNWIETLPHFNELIGINEDE